MANDLTDRTWRQVVEDVYRRLLIKVVGIAPEAIVEELTDAYFAPINRFVEEIIIAPIVARLNDELEEAEHGPVS